MFTVTRREGKKFLLRTCIQTNNTHGTAVRFHLPLPHLWPQGLSPTEAITEAKVYVHTGRSTKARMCTGKGNGPLNHFFNPQKLIKNDVE